MCSESATSFCLSGVQTLNKIEATVDSQETLTKIVQDRRQVCIPHSNIFQLRKRKTLIRAPKHTTYVICSSFYFVAAKSQTRVLKLNTHRRQSCRVHTQRMHRQNRSGKWSNRTSHWTSWSQAWIICTTAVRPSEMKSTISRSLCL